MSSFDLKRLAEPQIRNALLLAEVAAWLHDDFKHTDGHIHQYVTNAPLASGRQDTGDLVPTRPITLLGKTLTFDVVKKRKADDFCIGYLNRCHYAAHIEKEESNIRQSDPAYLSSPFGYEGHVIPRQLTSALRSGISWSVLSAIPFTHVERCELQKEIAELFARVGGDTRRPVNEITLWEWSYAVGALYKAALAGAILGHQPEANKLRWRLLSVRVDSAAFLDTATRLPDLLARQKLLTDAFDRVRVLLEETYPLGTEVYRDENSSVFVVPNIENLLESVNDAAQSLRTLIVSEFNIAGEILPEITLDSIAWWGQDPDWEEKKKRGEQPKDEIPPIGTVLAAVPLSHPNSRQIVVEWRDRLSDVCPVCGLRPQADSKSNDPSIRRAGERKVCLICGQRGAGRAKDWADKKLDTTIWTDEVADVNGRLALIVGQFRLDDWLDGKMVQTLTITEPQNGQAVVKNPSFARTRRVWETTRCFWSEIQEDVSRLFTDDRRRLRISLDPEPDLGDFQVYELDLDKTMLSMMWCNDGDKGYLISTDNLGYIAKQLGAEKEIYTDPATAAIFVEDHIREHFVNGKKKQAILRNPEAAATERRRNLVEGCRIEKTEHEDAAYTTAIPILAEPRTFMALVPANRALEVVKAIKAKYEREMSKVRNRLLLTLGVVYFGRRTPLAAALDAGRRMLKARVASGEWRVAGKPDMKDLLPNGWPRAVEVTLQKGDRQVHVEMQTVMGDGSTADVWYPYWHVTAWSAGNEPETRARWFKGMNGEYWVHVAELKQNDTVTFTPSTFDFEFLDTTARRFEVSYGADGQRRSTEKQQRPYLLEEMENVDQVWALLRDGLSKTQMRGLETLIETKRAAWNKPKGAAASALPSDDALRQLCHDALVRAEWRNNDWKNQRELLERAALSGMLADALELHLEIMKEEPQKEAKHE